MWMRAQLWTTLPKRRELDEADIATPLRRRRCRVHGADPAAAALAALNERLVTVSVGYLAFIGVAGVWAAPPTRAKGTLLMSMQDKIKNKAEVLKGKVKETVGKATGNDQWVVEGKLDQGKGNLKQAGEKIKDARKGVFGE